MTYTFRPVNVETDAPELTAIRNEIYSEPMTVEEYTRILHKVPPQTTLYRSVALDESGAIAGTFIASNDPWDAEGHWGSVVRVAKAHRGRGLGKKLFEQVVAHAREGGCTHLFEEVRDNDSYSLEWAKHRGFDIDRHLFESTLTVAEFDESRFAGTIERLEAEGIRFTTMAEAGVRDWAPKLYAMHKVTVFDIPGVTLKEYPPYEVWQEWALDPKMLPPELSFIAIHNDRIVGGTGLMYKETTRAMYTDYTGVVPDYRGRDLALALKLLSVRAARAYGAPYMRTNNDSKNAPMLAVNRKMGYVPCPGFYRMVKRFEA